MTVRNVHYRASDYLLRSQYLGCTTNSRDQSPQNLEIILTERFRVFFDEITYFFVKTHLFQDFGPTFHRHQSSYDYF